MESIALAVLFSLSLSLFPLQAFVGYSAFAGVIANRSEVANERDTQHNGGIINNVNKILWFLWLFIIAHWKRRTASSKHTEKRNNFQPKFNIFWGFICTSTSKIHININTNSQMHIKTHISFNLFHHGNFSLLFSASRYNVCTLLAWKLYFSANEECRHHAKWLNGFWLEWQQHTAFHKWKNYPNNSFCMCKTIQQNLNYFIDHSCAMRIHVSVAHFFLHLIFLDLTEFGKLHL